MRFPWSIRTRLIVTVATVAAVVMVVSSVFTLLTVRHYLSQRVDDRMISNAGRIRAGLEGLSGLRMDLNTVVQMARSDTSSVILMVDGRPALTANADSAMATAVAEVDLSDGRPHLVPALPGVRAIRIDTSDTGLTVTQGRTTVRPDAIVLAVDPTGDVGAIQTLVLGSAGANMALIAALVLLSVIIVSRGLRPLQTMSQQARAVVEGDRTARLTVSSDDPDITRLAETVNEAFDARQRAEDRLRTFVADASHELRTPLTTATGWIDLYAQGGLSDPEERDQAMVRVQTELGRMRTLIDDLAMLARMDAVRPLELEPVDLAQLADEVAEDARVVNPDRAITVFSAGAAPIVADGRKVQQVLVNLVGNAVQHTPAGTPVEITVAPSTQPLAGGTAYTVLVTDHGQGIAAADQPHVFERFWRSDASRDRHTGGSGLGLSIVASLVAAHGGTYGLSSRAGEGTTVRVTLPAGRAAVRA